jgi:IS5 family transposase
MFTGLKAQLDFTDETITNILAFDHPLVKLKKIVPWTEINEVYRKSFKNPQRGNASKTTDLIIGLLLLKHIYKLSYRDLVRQLHENLSFMHFCSISLDEIRAKRDKQEKFIDHSTLVKDARRLGGRRIRKIVKIFTRALRREGYITGEYLFTDTTSLEKNILYPTEVSLLKRVIEHAEMVIQQVEYKKDMFKSAVIRKANQIAKVYYSTGKKTQELLTQISRKMLSLGQAQLEKMGQIAGQYGENLEKAVQKVYRQVKSTGVKILKQAEQKLSGQTVSDKIVSYYEPHVRALPKGKVHKPCEFGVKLRIDMSGEGYVTNYGVYKGNPNDSSMLRETIEEHVQEYGKEFKGGAMDRGFADRDQVRELEKKHNLILAIPERQGQGTDLPTKQKKKLYNQRSAIEAKISEGKRMTGLGLCRYKGWEGDLICAGLSILALNMRKILRDTAGEVEIPGFETA